jgi:AmiR/NasT family two-component response regulator
MGLADEGRPALNMALRTADVELKSENLAAALKRRTTIDLARGILMAQNHCTAQEAFEILSNASNNLNQKLHHVAREMTTGFAQSSELAHFNS